FILPRSLSALRQLSFSVGVHFCCGVVQIISRHFHRFRFTERAFLHQFRERSRQRRSRGAPRDPETFLGAQRIVERKRIRTVHHFVRIQRQQLLQHFLHLRRVKHLRLERSIQINIFY